MADYEFVTIWRFEAPQENVWDLIFHSENWPEWWPGVEKVEKLKQVRRGGISLAEMALRFILDNKDVSTIIPGMRKIANVEANTAASDRGALPGPVQAELRKHRWDRTPTKWSQ